MKPHFLPGDQVITRFGGVMMVTNSYQWPVSGNWSYVITDGIDTVQVNERDLWHVNDTVAKERAYARKGRVAPDNQDVPPVSAVPGADHGGED